MKYSNSKLQLVRSNTIKEWLASRFAIVISFRQRCKASVVLMNSLIIGIIARSDVSVSPPFLGRAYAVQAHGCEAGKDAVDARVDAEVDRKQKAFLYYFCCDGDVCCLASLG